MFGFNIYVAIATLTGLALFLSLKVKWKVIVAFFVMTQCFDLMPQIIYGHLTWDVGAIMLLIAAAQLMLMITKPPKIHGTSITILLIFIVWLLFCLAYSLFIYHYPWTNTLKSSRQMIIGYLSVFIFLRLFRVDETALSTILQWFYRITFALLIVAMIQYLIGRPILHGLVVEYVGAVRYVPVFLPIVFFFLWAIVSKYLENGRIKLHQIVYGGMAIAVTATTYTRGIYIAALVTFIVLLFLLQMQRRLKAPPSIAIIVLILSGVTILTIGGWADRVVGRASSGFSILLNERSDQSTHSAVDVNTFSGRLQLLRERIAFVAEQNPLIGFGFLHEGDVPKSLRSQFRYGSVVYSPDMVEKYKYGHPYVLALYSADIGWSNIVINSGFVGALLFALFVFSFLVSFRKNKNNTLPLLHYQTAFYLQTIMLLILMFNGNTFTTNVQIPALMIAGYLFCSARMRSDARQPLTTG